MPSQASPVFMTTAAWACSKFYRRSAAGKLYGTVTNDQIAAALKEGRTPYCHVVDGNEASLHLQRKMGLTCTRLPAIWVN